MSGGKEKGRGLAGVEAHPTSATRVPWRWGSPPRRSPAPTPPLSCLPPPPPPPPPPLAFVNARAISRLHPASCAPDPRAACPAPRDVRRVRCYTLMARILLPQNMGLAPQVLVGWDGLASRNCLVGWDGLASRNCLVGWDGLASRNCHPFDGHARRAVTSSRDATGRAVTSSRDATGRAVTSSRDATGRAVTSSGGAAGHDAMRAMQHLATAKGSARAPSLC